VSSPSQIRYVSAAEVVVELALLAWRN